MNEPTCPIADADTDVRYLAGQLSDADAEAFEEHYFGCDICRSAVQRGAEIRSALASEPAAAPQRETPVLSPASRLPKRERAPKQSPVRRAWLPLFAAAAVIVVVAGLWRAQRPVSETTPNINDVEPTRGSSTSPAISATAADKTLAASWPRTQDAQTYRVRLVADDGRLLFDREIPDTSIVVPVDALASPKSAAAIYWQVEALNGLRAVVSNYALKEARPGR